MSDGIKLWAMIIDGGIVRGTAGWNGIVPFTPPPGVLDVVELEPDEPCGPGWLYDAGGNPRFTPPPPDA